MIHTEILVTLLRFPVLLNELENKSTVLKFWPENRPVQIQRMISFETNEDAE
jgi:hypothetical protein